MRIATLASLAVLLTACASSPPRPPTPAEMLTSGPWACESALGPGTIKSTQTYKPDGTAIAELVITGEGQGMKVDAAGTANAKWKLLENDTKLEQVLEGVTVTRANLNGMNIDPNLAQGMIAPYIAGQSASSTIEITPASLKLTATDATTTCARKP